jgi:hypothetical protein
MPHDPSEELIPSNVVLVEKGARRHLWLALWAEDGSVEHYQRVLARELEAQGDLEAVAWM